MINLHEQKYSYLEEANEGILRNFPFQKASNEATVLDVGCGRGALSQIIQKNGCIVWGIESNKPASISAAQRISRVINADLTDLPTIKKEISENSFDFIIFSDVLEHTYDPFLILKEYLGFLKKGGYILISVPNVAVWTNRLKLLFGRFEYSDTGVMDRTHIRFFTFKTIKALVKAAGCSITKIDYTPYFVRAILPLIKSTILRKQDIEKVNRRILIDSPIYRFYMKYVYSIEYFLGYLWKPLFAFRIIVIAQKI